MTGAVDVSLVMTAHREGYLCGVSARSLMAARQKAIDAGLDCETLVILDNADALTRAVVTEALGDTAAVFETDLGDPGRSRNFAAQKASGRFTTYLDGDDLWSRNWVTEAVKFACHRPDAIAHSACNVFFGTSNGLWWHVDSESALCDPGYLRWMNYWDAMTLAETKLYREYPFRPNAIGEGYGHEDWHWNIMTLAAGIAHKPVPGTVHFKRRRRNSQSGLVDDAKGMPFPEPKADFDRSAFVEMLRGLRIR